MASMNTRTTWQPWFSWYPVMVSRELALSLYTPGVPERIRRVAFLRTVSRRRVDGHWEYRLATLTPEEYEDEQW